MTVDELVRQEGVRMIELDGETFVVGTPQYEKIKDNEIPETLPQSVPGN